MFAFSVDNVNTALWLGIDHLLHEGIEEDSRNGPVIVAPGPVCTVYTKPTRHVVFSATRDANPFFHFMEALWMLHGGSEIAFPTLFTSKYGQYSDDGKTMWGAYGWRWRSFFGWDQLRAIIEELRKNPTSRRCVLSMWNSWPQAEQSPSLAFPISDHPDAFSDGWDDFYVATHGGKDVPCNTQAYVDVRGGRLNLTVLNRSNDIILGCYGANAVHFSMLACYLADKLDIEVGEYRQFSNNFHSYTNVFSREKLETIADESEHCAQMYKHLENEIDTMYEGENYGDQFDYDLKRFMEWSMAIVENRNTHKQPEFTFKTQFFSTVAVPMFLSWMNYKNRALGHAIQCASDIAALDWRTACIDWLERRNRK